MAPKKNGMTASTPAIANNVASFRGIVDSSGPSSIEESSFVIRSEISNDITVKTNILPNKTISTFDLMKKAIEFVGLPRKGASYIAILKWIIKYKENVGTGMLKTNLKKAIIKGLENGNLKRAAVSKSATGLHGYFMLNEDSLKKQTESNTRSKKTVKKKENKDINERGSLSDTEITKKSRKKNPGRLNKSATEDDGRKKITSKRNAIAKVKSTSVRTSKTHNAQASNPKKAPAASNPKKAPAASNPKKAPAAPKPKKAPASPKPKKAPASPKPKKAPASPKPKKAPAAPKPKKAPAPKEKTAHVSKAKNAPTRKEKEALVEKTKPTVVSTSESETEIASTSNPESENTLASEPGTALVLDSVPKPAPISKTITLVEKILKEAEPVPKRKIAKARGDEIVLEEPEMTNLKQVPEKSKKKTALKPANKNIPRAKKLYTTRTDPVSNMSRKDLSDTELTVKPINRKSMKSYSSDTEIDAVKKEKATKATRNRFKVADTNKLATEVSEAGPSKSKATRKQKVKNAV